MLLGGRVKVWEQVRSVAPGGVTLRPTPRPRCSPHRLHTSRGPGCEWTFSGPAQLALVIRVSAQTWPPQRSSLTFAPTQPDSPSPQRGAPASCRIVHSEQVPTHVPTHTKRHVSVPFMLMGAVATTVPVVLFLDAAFFADTAGPVPTPGTAPSTQWSRGPRVQGMRSGSARRSPQAGSGRV